MNTIQNKRKKTRGESPFLKQKMNTLQRGSRGRSQAFFNLFPFEGNSPDIPGCRNSGLFLQSSFSGKTALEYKSCSEDPGRVLLTPRSCFFSRKAPL